jgi:TM2 domain-containing membrane protein YozV
MTLSTEQQILIEQRVANEAKSAGVAYLLWLFAGGFGMHRLYIGRTLSGLIMLLLMPVGIVMMLNKNHYGAFLVVFFVVWVIVDLFLISGMLKSQKENVRSAMTKELTAKNQTP